MKTDIIAIDNHGAGFERVLDETGRTAVFKDLNKKQTMALTLCAEEMLSMARSITGEVKASFWIECEEKNFELHLSTKTVMDKEKRQLLLSASTSRKNEAANTLLGRIRDAFETAMAADPDRGEQLPMDLLADLPGHPVNDREWDGYERSILRKVADQVKIGIRGGTVDMAVCISFD